MDMFFWLLIFLFVLIVILLVGFFFLGVFKPQPPAKDAYVKQEYLLSAAEHEFFRVLLQSVGTDMIVCPKVRIADLITVHTSYLAEGKAWWKKFSAIAQKHLDFTLCEKATMRPVLGIELDDKSHQTARGIKRDAEVNRMMDGAKMPLLHIPYSYHGYSVQQIKAQIAEATRVSRSPAKTGHKKPSQFPAAIP